MSAGTTILIYYNLSATLFTDESRKAMQGIFQQGPIKSADWRPYYTFLSQLKNAKTA